MHSYLLHITYIHQILRPQMKNQIFRKKLENYIRTTN